MIRLVRIILGPDAVQSKFECGISLVILGIQHVILHAGIQCKPSAAKVARWLRIIREALASGVLSPGLAQKLAGKLNWATSKMFRRFGRALLRPIYDQCSRCDDKMGMPLRRALSWWETALENEISETKEWNLRADEPIHIFCDARGAPPHLAAVLVTRERTLMTHMPAPTELLDMFIKRNDNQIMGLELLGLALALSTFREMIRGKCIIMHCDNSGAEVAFSKGSARAWDHAQLVNAMWAHALLLKIDVHIVRVSSESNIADLPTRMQDAGKFDAVMDLFSTVGAVVVPPVLDETYYKDETWCELRERVLSFLARPCS